MADNNVLNEKDIQNIKDALTRGAIAAEKHANEKEWPSIVRASMLDAAKSYRDTLEKVSQQLTVRAYCKHSNYPESCLECRKGNLRKVYLDR